MENFTFQNPTKIIFGRGGESQVGIETNRFSKRILLHYGSGSIKKSGLYDQVTASLRQAGVFFMELPGVKPNPRLSLVYEGIRLCRENNLDFILAVGGGSVIDSAKAIAMGVPYTGDVWDFYTSKAEIKESLPVGTVLTIPAAGSEASLSSVITKEEGSLKRALSNSLIFPRFSILDPGLCFTLPPYQVACGASDIIAHLNERYFTNTPHVELIDRLIEATEKTVVGNVPAILEKPDDYDAWAEVMWSGTIAHNELLNTGRGTDWASHNIEHELSGIYDIAHGAGLAVIFPAWMQYVYKHDIQRFVQYAVRVWNIDQDFFSPEKTALAGIRCYTSFLRSIGLPTTLGEAGIRDDRLEEMASKCTNCDQWTLGGFVRLKQADVLNILQLARKGQ